VDSIDARIIPIPFEVVETMLNRMTGRIRLGLDAFCLNRGPEGLQKVLPKVRRYVGDRFALRSRYCGDN